MGSLKLVFVHRRSFLTDLFGAHSGYLIHSFLSPLTNTRTDTYGTDRTLFLLRILRAIRAIWPEEKPIWVRLSCTDYMEHSGEKSWTVEDSVELCKVMKKEGLADLIDCSGGGLVSGQKIPLKPGYQVGLFGGIYQMHLTELPPKRTHRSPSPLPSTPPSPPHPAHTQHSSPPSA